MTLQKPNDSIEDTQLVLQVVYSFTIIYLYFLFGSRPDLYDQKPIGY